MISILIVVDSRSIVPSSCLCFFARRLPHDLAISLIILPFQFMVFNHDKPAVAACSAFVAAKEQISFRLYQKCPEISPNPLPCL
jgi:hypothetical protein